MKFTKRGKKKFTLEKELSKGFVARVTESRLDLESISKSWKISFSKSTTEYAYALYLLQHNNVNELALATAMLFNCTRVFTDAEMLKVVMTAMQKLDKKRANNMAKQSAKEDDSEILDNEVCKANSDYEAKRANSVTMTRLSLVSLPEGSFYKWQKSKGKLGGQNKVPRLSNSRTIADELLEYRNI